MTSAKFGSRESRALSTLEATMSVSQPKGTKMPGSSEARQPDVVCILGMHRSGTSLLTRMLNLLGVYLGPERLLMKPSFANPKGFWEHDEIVSVNDQILELLGGTWKAPPIFPPGWENSSMLDDLKQHARRLIQDSFADVEMWGWKDPRSCLTLPFWQQILPDMRYIVCLRNPVDVARSLEPIHSISAEKSSDLWLTYVNSALEYSDGKPRLLIFYEDLMDDSLRELRRLAVFLGKPERAEQVDVQEAVQEFIEGGLQHYRTSIVEATAKRRIALRARALYLAQRISVSFGRKEIDRQRELDHQIEKALDILSQYSFNASGKANPLIEQLGQLEDQLAESANSVRLLQTELTEQGKELEAVSARLAETEEALKLNSIALQERDGIVETLSTQLADKDATVQTLSTQLIEKDGIVQTLSAQLAERDRKVQSLTTDVADKEHALQMLSFEIAEQNRALQSQTQHAEERIGRLATQLRDSETQLKRITNTLGWRLLSRFGPIKYRFLLPVYRMFSQLSNKRTATKPPRDDVHG